MKRLFICDPMCALSFGHNVSSMVYYRNYFRDHFQEIACLGALPLNETLASEKKISRFFHYYYNAFIPMETTDHIIESDVHVRVTGSDPTEHLAMHDTERLFNTFKIADEDSIFFPSADYYGVRSILRKISEIPAAAAPVLYLRFIGVMENASKFEERPAVLIFEQLRNLMNAGYRIRVAAETPPYSDYLARILNSVVFVAPYPETSAPLPLHEKRPFLIYAAGSARRDKGFFRLFDIFAEIRRRHSELDIKFVTQTLPDRDIIHERKYVAQMYALPGMEILPATITDVQMQDTYRRSHLIVLPYDPEIYRHRGSAVTFEAISTGRPILSQPQTGFATQISYYGMGTLCSSSDEYATAALHYYRLSLDDIALQCRQARTRFIIDTNATYREWMQ